MSDDRCFIDSNIWLYAFIQQPNKDKRHEEAQALISRCKEIVISEQVVAEVSANLLKKGQLSESRLSQIIEAFYHRYQVLAPSLQTHQSAGKLRGRYCLSYWDSLIVAVALQTHCTVLYSEDMQNGLILDGGLRIENPLSGLNATNMSV